MEYQLKNFKAFGAPASIPIRPITLLFGPNSSGKSSIIQSLLMLSQSLSPPFEQPNGNGNQNVLIPNGPLVNLGSYEEFVYKHDIGNEFSIALTDTFKSIEEIGAPVPIRIDKFDPQLGWTKQIDPLSDNSDERIEKAMFKELSDKILNKTISIETFFKVDNTQRVICNKKNIAVDGHSFTLNIIDENKVFNPDNPPLYELSGNYKSIFAKNYEDAFFINNCDHSFEDTKAIREISRWMKYLYLNEQENGKEIPDLQSLLTILFSCMKELAFCTTSFGELKEFFLVWENLSKEQQKKAYEKIKEVLAPYRSGNYIADILCLPLFMWSKGILGCSVTEWGFLEDVGHFILFPYPTLLNPSYKLMNEIKYIPPLRQEPERIFFLNEEDEKPTAKIYYTLWHRDKGEYILPLINEELEKLGIDYKVELWDQNAVETDETIGFSIFLEKLTNDVKSNFRDVGFGISQILPIVFNCVINKMTKLLIEQPELHLHPALQAELGDLFIRSALGEQKNTFVIETHSEHLILRLLRRIRETTEGTLPDDVPPIKPDDVAVVYIQPGKNGSEAIHLDITPDGDFAQPWPNGFFTERIQELL